MKTCRCSREQPAGEFPSGSTIKPVFAAAALNEEIITPTTSFLSAGGLNIGPWFFPDWRAGGHGTHERLSCHC